MNLALFFEGTGQGVEGRFTNVTRLYGVTADSPRQQRHLESGPGTHFGAYLCGKAMGVDARAIFARARRWFETRESGVGEEKRVYLFGFSRGALIARHFAAWLDKLGVEVAYLGIWDTVDSTVKLDVSEECPPNVRHARHAVARDEHRKHFDYVPLRGDGVGRRQLVEEMLFPGAHSDVGGLYSDNHEIADETLRWIAEGASLAGLELSEVPRPAAEKALKDSTGPVIHDSLGLISNLFGLLGRIERRFGDIVRHPLCDRV